MSIWLPILRRSPLLQVLAWPSDCLTDVAQRATGKWHFAVRSGFCFWLFVLVAGCGVVRMAGCALVAGDAGVVGVRWGVG
jgi:hypothetical protein